MGGVRLAWVLPIGLLVLAGCTVGPDFRRPVVESPSVWGPERSDVPSRTIADDVDPAWWGQFHDAELSALVGRLVASNLDLQAAAERIVQGRAQREVTRSMALPHIDERSEYTRNRQSPNGFVSLVTPAPGAPLEYDMWQNGLTSTWELDLFGRVRRAIEAQDAAVLASVENRRGVALAALAELADDYLRLRGVQVALGIAERNLEAARQNVKLVGDRFANGVATTLDTAQAQSQLATIAATVPPLRTQEAAAINAIGLLLAEPPRALAAELSPRAPLPAVPPAVAVGLPGALVRRRPDVREAEAQLHAATAQTGVAVADFYPDVSLTGSFELNGLKFANAFALPDRMFQVGPTLTIPIFRGGQLTGQLHLDESRQREAALAFQRTVLNAWREVDDALTAYAEAQAERIQTAEAVRQNQVALDAARQRYVAGAADFLNVIASETQLLQSENMLANSDVAIATDLVTLYRALGGGWEVAELGGTAGEGHYTDR